MISLLGVPVGLLLRRATLLRKATETWIAAFAAAPVCSPAYPLFLVIFGRSAWTIIMIGFVAGMAPVILKTLEGLTAVRHVLLNVGRTYSLTPWRASGRSSSRPRCRPSSLASAWASIFSLINIVGVEFLMNFGGLGQLINELAERYDLPGVYASICFVVLVSVIFFASREKAREMAETGSLRGAEVAPPAWRIDPVLAVRVAIIVVVLGLWEALAASGLLYKDVVPSLVKIAAALLPVVHPGVSTRIGVTAMEVGVAMLIGGASGIVVGLALGSSRFISRAWEPSLLPGADAQDHLLSRDDHVVRRRSGLQDGDGRDLLLLPRSHSPSLPACAASTGC